MMYICWPAMLSCKVTRQNLLNTFSWTNVQLQFFNQYHETCHKFAKKMRSYFSCIPNKKTVNFIDIQTLTTYQTEYTVSACPWSMHCDDISGRGHRQTLHKVPPKPAYYDSYTDESLMKSYLPLRINTVTICVCGSFFLFN